MPWTQTNTTVHIGIGRLAGHSEMMHLRRVSLKKKKKFPIYEGKEDLICTLLLVDQYMWTSGTVSVKGANLRNRNESDSFNPKDIIWWRGLWQTNGKCRESLLWIFAIKILVKLFPHPAYISSCTFSRPSKHKNHFILSSASDILQKVEGSYWCYQDLWSPAVPSHQLILTVSACFRVDVFERLPNDSKVHLNLGSCRLGSACFSVTANIPAFSSAWLDVLVVGLGTEGGVTHCAGHAAHNLSWEHLFNLVRRFQEKIHHLKLWLV